MSRDFFRDTSIRYLGYANEVGEAFRPVISPQLVRYSYGVAGAYVIADTAHKGVGLILKEGPRPLKFIATIGDALIWQTLASIVIPGIVINRISAYSQVLLQTYTKNIPLKSQKWMAIGISLAAIPIIVRPIDTAVTMFMSVTYRPLFGTYPS